LDVTCKTLIYELKEKYTLCKIEMLRDDYMINLK